jgi:hypothetical protein
MPIPAASSTLPARTNPWRLVSAGGRLFAEPTSIEELAGLVRACQASGAPFA